jgi:hypothetical protein
MFINWMARLRWERWHPRLFASLRFAGGVVFLILAVILRSYHIGGWWWPTVLAALAALEFYTAYRLPPAIAATRR